jgi:hypothetical protein
MVVAFAAFSLAAAVLIVLIALGVRRATEQ